MLNDKFVVNHLRCKLSGYIFVFPDVENVSTVSCNDTEIKLPSPTFHGGTEKTNIKHIFLVDLK